MTDLVVEFLCPVVFEYDEVLLTRFSTGSKLEADSALDETVMGAF